MKLLQGIQQLREAFYSQDWGLVKLAYLQISGEELEDSQPLNDELPELPPPKKRARKPKLVKEVDAEHEEITRTAVNQQPKGYSGPVRFRGNTFKDTGTLHSQDREVDKLLWKGRQVPERRPPSKKITAVCRKCGAEDKVSSTLIFKESSYVCNSCGSKR